jgi:hypothetical protein
MRPTEMAQETTDSSDYHEQTLQNASQEAISAERDDTNTIPSITIVSNK